MSTLSRYLVFSAGFVVLLFLSGCSSGAENAMAVTESIQTDEEALITEMNNITEVESKLQSAFESTLNEDEELKTFADGTSDVFANIETRNDSLQTVEEITGQMEEHYSSLTENNGGLPEAELEALTGSLETITSTLNEFTAHYADALSAEATFFESLADEDATYETLEEGIETIVSENETTAQFLVDLDEQLVSLENNKNTLMRLLNEELEA